MARAAFRKKPDFWISMTLGAVILAALGATRLYSNLLFISLVEIFSIVVLLVVFVIAWNARDYLEHDYLLFLGIACLSIAGLDLLHTLSHVGMGVFPGQDANLSTSLWIAARYTQAAAWLLAPLWIRRRINRWTAVLAWCGMAMLLGILIFAGLFPVTADAKGLTLFKVLSEYAVIIGLAGGMWLLWQQRTDFAPHVIRLLVASLMVAILAEFLFTLYSMITDALHMGGLLLRLVSGFLLYQAMVVTGIRYPFELMFRDLKRKEETLRQNQKQLAYQATHDPCTGLPNRSLFSDRLTQAMERTRRLQYDNGKRYVGVFLLDLDDFKQINDQRGHAAGDQVLLIIADRLRNVVRKSDTIARFGGDEFVVVTTDLSGPADALAIGRKILETVATPFALESSREEVHGSMGISLFPDHAGDEENLMRCADLALYAAKRKPGRAVLYSLNDPEVQAVSREMSQFSEKE